MTFKQGLILGVVFLVIALAGSAGVFYGVAQVVGVEGPKGEQGEQGPKGERGSTGARGAAGTSGSSSSLEFSIRSLATYWAAVQVGENTQHPQTQACVDYIMDFTGSGADCGFTRVED